MSFIHLGTDNISLYNQRLEILLARQLETIEVKEERDRMWPSSSGHCSRKGVLSASQKQVTKGASSYCYYEIGKTIEDIVLYGFDKYLLFDNYRLPSLVKYGVNISGKIDAIIVKPEGSGRKIYLLEVKSCGDVPTKPKSYQLAQLAVYIAITGIDGYMFYFSRQVAAFNGDLKAISFKLEFNDPLVRKALFNTVFAYLCRVERLLPDIPHDFKKSHCGLCDFKKMCWDYTDFDFNGKFKVQNINQQDKVRLTNKAVEVTDLIIKDVRERRNGVLKHIQKYSRYEAAQVLEKSAWSSLL